MLPVARLRHLHADTVVVPEEAEGFALSHLFGRGPESKIKLEKVG